MLLTRVKAWLLLRSVKPKIVSKIFHAWLTIHGGHKARWDHKRGKHSTQTTGTVLHSMSSYSDVGSRLSCQSYTSDDFRQNLRQTDVRPRGVIQSTISTR